MNLPNDQTREGDSSKNLVLTDLDGDGIPDVVSINIRWLIASIFSLITAAAATVL